MTLSRSSTRRSSTTTDDRPATARKAERASAWRGPPRAARACGDERDVSNRWRVGRIEVAREPSNGAPLCARPVTLSDQGRELKRLAKVDHSNLSSRAWSAVEGGCDGGKVVGGVSAEIGPLRA